MPYTSKTENHAVGKNWKKLTKRQRRLKNRIFILETGFPLLWFLTFKSVSRETEWAAVPHYIYTAAMRHAYYSFIWGRECKVSKISNVVAQYMPFFYVALPPSQYSLITKQRSCEATAAYVFLLTRTHKRSWQYLREPRPTGFKLMCYMDFNSRFELGFARAVLLKGYLIRLCFSSVTSNAKPRLQYFQITWCLSRQCRGTVLKLPGWFH